MSVSDSSARFCSDKSAGIQFHRATEEIYCHNSHLLLLQNMGKHEEQHKHSLQQGKLTGEDISWYPWTFGYDNGRQICGYHSD